MNIDWIFRDSLMAKSSRCNTDVELHWYWIENSENKYTMHYIRVPIFFECSLLPTCFYHIHPYFAAVVQTAPESCAPILPLPQNNSYSGGTRCTSYADCEVYFHCRIWEFNYFFSFSNQLFLSTTNFLSLFSESIWEEKHFRYQISFDSPIKIRTNTEISQCAVKEKISSNALTYILRWKNGEHHITRQWCGSEFIHRFQKWFLNFPFHFYRSFIRFSCYSPSAPTKNSTHCSELIHSQLEE